MSRPIVDPNRTVYYQPTWKDRAHVIMDNYKRNLKKPDMPWEPIFITLALAGEAGELANVVKKIWRGNMPDEDRKNKLAQMKEELADVIIYAGMLCEEMGWDLDGIAEEKLNIVDERWKKRQHMVKSCEESLARKAEELDNESSPSINEARRLGS